MIDPRERSRKPMIDPRGRSSRPMIDPRERNRRPMIDPRERSRKFMIDPREQSIKLIIDRPRERSSHASVYFFDQIEIRPKSGPLHEPHGSAGPETPHSRSLGEKKGT